MNRTHDFRTSRCAGYLLDHSGDEYNLINTHTNTHTHTHTHLKGEGEGEGFYWSKREHEEEEGGGGRAGGGGGVKQQEGPSLLGRMSGARSTEGSEECAWELYPVSNQSSRAPPTRTVGRSSCRISKTWKVRQ